MIILNCETRVSTLDSLSLIYNVLAPEIELFLQGIDLEQHYIENSPQISGEKELIRLFEQKHNCVVYPVDRVFWFHLTRAKPGTDFGSGIFPLIEVLPSIWDTLEEILKGTEHESLFRNFRNKGIQNSQYQLKTSSCRHSGPYAMLVRESAFRCQEMGTHDYLKLPEIIEDICNGFYNSTGIMIHKNISINLVPHIVKFWSTEKTGKDCIESAMYYLYLTAHNQKLTIYANTCFDGGNCAIKPEQIVQIETN